MAILAGDIKLVASQVMDDVPEGGGAPTSSVIQDATSNSIFNDISELDRAGGRVNLRKVFAHVRTTNTDDYLGGNVIVADPPDDPRVSVSIFKAADVFDRRTDARDRIEAYLNKGSLWDGYLLENHLAGQRTLQIFSRTTASLPPIGRTLYLVQNEGAGNEYSQYVRVIDVTVEKRTFTYAVSGAPVDYEANVLTIDLSDALRYDFPGSPPSRWFAQENGKAKLRDTVVADAAKYYGAVATVDPVDLGDVSARVASIFTQLVPSAQTETPLIDVRAAGDVETLVPAGAGTMSYTTSLPMSPAVTLYLGNPITPGTLSIAAGTSTLTDSGGELLDGTTVIGTVDYTRGTVTLASSAPTYTGSKTATFLPAAAPIQLVDSASTYVSIEGRSYNYVLTINPIPAPRTLVVSYMSQGKWYDLRDNGAGQLKGSDPTFGVGTISYTTGTVAVTLGALPDVGSEIIYNWGGKVLLEQRVSSPYALPKIRLALGKQGLIPGSVDITWNDGQARTASDDGFGNISGDATGNVRYRTGVVEFTPSTLPLLTQTYAVSCNFGVPETQTFNNPTINGDGSVDFTITGGNLNAGTLELEYDVNAAPATYEGMTSLEMRLIGAWERTRLVRDDGQGVLKTRDGATVGTVNYATGAVHLDPAETVKIPVGNWYHSHLGECVPHLGPPGRAAAFAFWRHRLSGWSYEDATTELPSDGSASIKATFCQTGAGNAWTETVVPGLFIDLTHHYVETIVPGSLIFAYGGKTYFDRLGVLYYDIDLASGAGVPVGTINYGTREIRISTWVPGATNTYVVRSAVTRHTLNAVDDVAFRIPIAPVRPASVQLLATQIGGTTLNLSADIDGNLSAAGVVGTVDYETGVVHCRFGSWMTAAGNEGQPWYKAEAVVDGKIFKPLPVIASSIKYNAVAYSYLPLDADILGLDPVRLPQDGRVPIFRKGDFAVIGHTDTVGPLTVSNAQVVDCGRVRLSRVRVIDGDGELIETGYSADLEAGTVTFANVTGYAQPVTVEHRIEDMAQISDVQINGGLSFTRQITHDYPAGSVVSAALVAGDLHARVSYLFDQATWDGVWQNSVRGSIANGTYNDALAPLVVTNAGALSERWALVFASASSFNIIGEHVGVIGTGSIGADCAPVNPTTGQPYFVIPSLGWGAGWSAGNVLRFNTVGAVFPVWVVRTIQQGPETVPEDSFTLLIRGDVDRP